MKLILFKIFQKSKEFTNESEIYWEQNLSELNDLKRTVKSASEELGIFIST